jgi:hypothetical protein
MTNKILIFSTVFLLFQLPFAIAQNGVSPVGGTRAIGMANVGATFTDINSLFSNQAGLAMLENITATAFAEQRFQVSELQSVTAGAAIPTNSGTFGISVNYFGFEDYNEQRAGIAYARKLMDKLSIGAQVLLLNTQIPEYGNNANVTFELGLLAQLLPQLNLGLHLYSPIRVALTPDEYLPTVYKLGLNYMPSDNLSLLAEVEKDIDYPVRTRVGAEYQLLDLLRLRIGVATAPVNLSFGLGYQVSKGLSLDIASYYHEILGFSPAAGITYAFGKK